MQDVTTGNNSIPKILVLQNIIIYLERSKEVIIYFLALIKYFLK